MNKGVQEPSQVRYIEYFDKMLFNPNFKGLDLTIYEIKNVYITGIKLNDGESITYKFQTNYYKEADANLFLSKDNGQVVTGDVTINIYRNGKLKAWVFFNTFFIQPNDNRLFFHIKDIDPRFLLKEPDYSLMTIEIVIYPYQYINNNNSNNNNNNMDQLNNINESNNNNSLIDDMLGIEMNKIRKMNEYLYYANAKNPGEFYKENKILFFGDENDDISEILFQINNKK